MVSLSERRDLLLLPCEEDLDTFSVKQASPISDVSSSVKIYVKLVSRGIGNVKIPSTAAQISSYALKSLVCGANVVPAFILEGKHSKSSSCLYLRKS